MIMTRRPCKILKRIEKATATAFQKKVWKILLTIPKGETKSYSWVARKVGSPAACRAVGQALHKNPFAPEGPCHRVIRKDGSLGGYSKGVARKKVLLQGERVERTASTILPVAKSISSSVVHRPSPNRSDE